MRTRDLLVVALATLILATGAYLWLAPAGLARAPAVSVTTLEGGTVSLSRLRGRPVLVTFWATDCPGCMEEMPHLIDLYRDLGPEGLEIIGIAMPYDPPEQVRALDRQRDIPYPIALDPNGEATAAFGDVKLTPTSFLIAPDGRIVKQKIGVMDMAKLRDQIRGMLSKTAAAAGAGTGS